MSIAAIWGTTVGYTEYNDTVGIETNDGRVSIISMSTFDYLYSRLDEFTAALKEDCIEYVVHYNGMPLCIYPEWYIEALYNGLIFNDDGIYTFYDTCGEIAMSPESIILRNFMGELMYMETVTFDKYYDTLGG